MSNTTIHAETIEEIIITLENNATFYQQWLAVAQQYLPCFFNAYTSSHGVREVQFHIPEPETFFTPDKWTNTIYQRMLHLVREERRRLHIVTPDDVQNCSEWTACYFARKLVLGILSGDIQIADTQAQALALLHSPKMSKARASRETGLSLSHINRLLDTYPQDVFARYQAVQQGKCYAAVMGDCEPYVHNYPKFNPVQYLDGTSHVAIQPGDLVAESGSSRWYTVKLPSQPGALVFTHRGGIIHHPLRYLSKEYAAHAAKFCSLVDGKTSFERAA